MSAELERGLQAIEIMSRSSRGLTFTDLATALGTSKGPTHRLLGELTRLGYSRADEFGRYHLTLRLPSYALQYLELIPLVELARPLLEELATASGELARLSLVDGDHLVRVAKVQGRLSGLKYDPLHGGNIPLACSASGLLLLSGLSDEGARARLDAEGFPPTNDHGSAAPRTIDEAMCIVHTARQQGYLYIPDIHEEGIAPLAYPVRATDNHDIVGVLTVSGPSFRFTQDAAHQVLPVAQKVAAELGHLKVADLLGTYALAQSAREDA